MDSLVAVGLVGIASVWTVLIFAGLFRIYVKGYYDGLRDLNERRPEPWWMRHVR